MIHRFAGLIQHWDQLMELPQEQSLGDPDVVASDVTQANPLKIYMPTTALVEAIEMNLAAIQQNREQVDTTPEKRAYTDAMIRQRERFLAELAQWDRDAVFIALYPATEYQRGAS